MSKITTKLNEIFSSILSKQKISDCTLQLTSGSSDGDGFIGRISRVIVTGKYENGETITKSYICKYPPEDQLEKDKYNSMDCFEREVYVYNHVLPEFEKIQHEYGIYDEREGFFAYPKCYHAEYDGESNYSILILEDLTSSGYQMHSTTNIVITEAEQMSMLFCLMGKFNAVSFALSRHKPEIMKTFKTLNNTLFRALSTNQLGPIGFRHCKLALESVKDDQEKVKLIEKVSPNIWDKIAEFCDSKLSEPYNVLAHGDCYINNMMFKYEVNIYLLFIYIKC